MPQEEPPQRGAAPLVKARLDTPRGWRRRTAVALPVIGLLAACGGGSEATASPTPTSSAGGLLRHVDRQAGFSIVYPSEWHFYETADKGVQLRVGPDGTTSASVRLVEYAAPADAQARLSVVHQLLESVKIVEEAPATVHGLSGWQEVYGVQSGSTPLVHIHVFLFEPNRLDTIVFETPVSRLQTYAATFDLMRDSFRLEGASPSPGRGGSPSPAPSR